ncbi:MAG: DUF3857 domain-containing protein [Myxococcota bacterium]
MRSLAPLLLLLASGCSTARVFSGHANSKPATLPVPENYDGGVEVLSEEGRFEWGADGVQSFRHEVRYRITDAKALDTWGRFQARWNPKRQARPELDVQTRLADGRVLRLDEQMVIQSEGDGTGERVLLARVPGAAVGAVVTRVVQHRELDSAPLFPAVSGRYGLGLAAPVQLSSVVLVTPPELRLRAAAVGFRAKSSETEEGGRRVVRITGRNLPAVLGSQPNLPEDVPERPFVVFGAEGSWSELAERFERALAAHFADPSVHELAHDLRANGAPQLIEAAQMEIEARIRTSHDGAFPRLPSAVLADGAASSVERAVLLAGLLRARGIDAEVGLSERGQGLRLRSRVPGLSGLDRGLVFVPEGDYFVDPERPFAAPGAVGTDIQSKVVWLGRSGELVRAPAAGAVDNRYDELRIVDLVNGPEVEFFEVTEASGSIESRLRARFTGASPEDLERQLSGYVRRSYRGGRLEDFGVEQGRFRLSLEGRGGRFVRSEGSQTTVFLPAPIIFTWLPRAIRDAVLADDDPTPEQRVAAHILADRVADFDWSEPYAASVRFDLRVPSSFALGQAPEPLVMSLGPAIYRHELVETQTGWAFDVTFAMDERRVGAQEIRALIGGLRELWAQPVPRVVFDDVALAALDEGEVVPGLRRLVDDASGSTRAGTYLRLARVLNEQRLGFAARRWADAAVALRPEDAATLMEASEILLHGDLGLRFGPHYERARAIGLLRKARRLRPRWSELDHRLAEVLSRNKRGLPNEDGGELEEAVALARAAVRAGAGEEAGRLLAQLLFRSGRPGDFLADARDMTRSFEVDAHRVAAEALTDGPDAGLKLAIGLELPDEVLQLAVRRAAAVLVERQAYGVAAELLARSPHTDASDAERITLYRSIDQGLQRSVTGPARPIRELQALLAEEAPSEDELQAVFTEEAWSKIQPRGGVHVLSRSARLARRRANESGLPVTWPSDLIRSRTLFDWEGDERTGFRVESKLENDEDQRSRGVWFVVNEGGYRIQAAESDLSLLGSKALYWLDQGRTRAADRWLDWAEDLSPRVSAPFRKLRDADASPAQRRRWAAAALTPADPRALDILRKAERGADAPLRKELVRAQLRGHALRGESEAQIEVARRLLAYEPASVEGHQGVFAGLWALGRYGEAEAWAKARADASGFDPLAAEELAQVASFQGRYAEADRYFSQVLDRGFATPETLNNLAWMRLFRGLSSDEEIDMAREAVERSGSEAAMHTLATHLVERQKIAEALELIQRRGRRRGRLEPDDWYVVGRALEWVGLEAEAREAYLMSKGEDAERPDSTWVLTKRRLAAMNED